MCLLQACLAFAANLSIAVLGHFAALLAKLFLPAPFRCAYLFPFFFPALDGVFLFQFYTLAVPVPPDSPTDPPAENPFGLPSEYAAVLQERCEGWEFPYYLGKPFDIFCP